MKKKKSCEPFPPFNSNLVTTGQLHLGLGNTPQEKWFRITKWEINFKEKN